MSTSTNEPTVPRDAPSKSAPAVDQRRPLSDLLDEELVWSLLDAAPDALVIADESGQLLLVNRRTEEMFGYERTELLGKPVEELVPDRFRRVHGAHRTRYRVEPRTRPMGAGDELFGRRRDGSEFPVEISLSPLKTASDLLVVASVRDISARVEAEAERRQVRELLDSTLDAIFIFDADTLRFSYVNNGAVSQVGYTRDDLSRMTLLHLAPEVAEKELRRLLAQLHGDLSSTTLRTVHRRRDGTDIPVEMILQAGTSLGDTSGSYIALVRDITERVEADERLRQAGEDLRVLEDRERIARDLHDTVIQRLFAAGMALQAVSARIARDDDSTAQRVEAVVDDLDDTIRDIRSTIYALSTQTARRAGLRHEILGVVEDHRPALATEPRLRFDGIVDAIPDGIAEHVLAVLREMLSNVARHAQAETVEITVDARDGVLLRVSDDGVGIPETPGAGHGLHNMADRATRLGGTFRVLPQGESGTLVEWSVPNTFG